MFLKHPSSPLLLLLHLLLFLAAASAALARPSPPPNFLYLNVKPTKLELNHTHILPTLNFSHAHLQVTAQKFHNTTLKLNLLHRDKLPHVHALRHRHRHAFNERIKRDAIRVATLVRRLSHAAAAVQDNSYKVASFATDVVSGMEEGSGEFFVRVGVGSPPRSQYMVIDSGSDIVWVQCQPCTQCYQQSDPVFNPADSSSFAGVSCGSAVCGRLDNTDCHAGRCRYEVSYGDGSYTKGTLALETITMGQVMIRDVAIGCGHTNQGMFIGAAGLLGLGGGSMSFIGQLGGQTGGAFSYCLVSRDTGSTGTLEFGRGAMPVGATWISLIRNPRAPSFYYIGLAGVGVGGVRVPIPEETFQLSEYGTNGVVMDTGTAVTRLPTAAYEAFRDAFTAQTNNLPRAGGVSIFDTCFDLNGFESIRVPTVSFYFSDGPVLTLPAKNFLIPVNGAGTFCLAFAPSPSGLSIIGNIQQEGIQISIDGANGFVGFGPNVC